MNSRSDSHVNWEMIGAIAGVLSLIVAIAGFKISGCHIDIDACSVSSSGTISSEREDTISSTNESTPTIESRIIIGKDIKESDLDGLDVKNNGNYYSFTFGEYMQGGSGEIQPIEWRVLAVKDGNVLVTSVKLLDYVPYNNDCMKVTWEKCTLRKWMNETFLNEAFSSIQQDKIVPVTNENPDNPYSGTKGGNSTQDRIFALSIREANLYFGSGSDKIAYSTDYVHAKGFDHKDYSSWWWLRSPGSENTQAANVRSNGRTDVNGYDVDCHSVAVRPAMWVTL